MALTNEIVPTSLPDISKPGEPLQRVVNGTCDFLLTQAITRQALLPQPDEVHDNLNEQYSGRDSLAPRAHAILKAMSTGAQSGWREQRPKVNDNEPLKTPKIATEEHVILEITELSGIGESDVMKLKAIGLWANPQVGDRTVIIHPVRRTLTGTQLEPPHELHFSLDSGPEDKMRILSDVYYKLVNQQVMPDLSIESMYGLLQEGNDIEHKILGLIRDINAQAGLDKAIMQTLITSDSSLMLFPVGFVLNSQDLPNAKLKKTAIPIGLFTEDTATQSTLLSKVNQSTPDIYVAVINQ